MFPYIWIMKHKKAHTVIAELYGMDARDVHENRHHYGLTKQPIYTIGDDYYAVGKAKPTDEFGQGWEAVAELHGRVVWMSKA